MPATGSAVVRLTRGHRYQTTWLAPVPCVLIPAQVASAALQAVGAQVGQSAPWTNMSFATRAKTVSSCEFDAEGTWSAPDAVIDPEVSQVPGVSQLLPQRIVDVTTNEVLYDAARLPAPEAPPPGPAPGRPSSTEQPPGPQTPIKSETNYAPLVVVGLAIVGAYFAFRRRS